MNYSFKMYRGDTFLSDFITLYNDDIPEFATPEELAAFTPHNLDNYEFSGQVRTEQDGLKLFDLIITKESSRFYFKIDANATKDLSGSDQTLVYDIQIKDIITDSVQTICAGSINVILDVTTANVF